MVGESCSHKVLKDNQHCEECGREVCPNCKRGDPSVHMYGIFLDGRWWCCEGCHEEFQDIFNESET